MKKKGNKKIPIDKDKEIIDNPILTSLFMFYAVVQLLWVDAILKTLVNVYTTEKQRCRDRGYQ